MLEMEAITWAISGPTVEPQLHPDEDLHKSRPTLSPILHHGPTSERPLLQLRPCGVDLPEQKVEASLPAQACCNSLHPPNGP